MRDQQSYRRFAGQLIVGMVVMGVALTAGAANQPNLSNVNLQNCDCQLATEMMAKLAPYGVSLQDGQRMVLHLSQGNLDGAKQVLAERGMTDEQIQFIEKNFQKEIEYGITSGAFNRLAGVAIEETARSFNVPADRLPDILFALEWKDEQALEKLGLSADQIKNIETYKEYFGYDAAALDAATENRALRAVLEQQGITDVDPLIAAYYDLGRAAFDDLLTDAGLDSEEFGLLVEQAEDAQYKALGFTDDEIEQIQQEAFLTDVAELSGFDGALQDYLEDQGFDEDEAAEFVEAVENDDLETIGEMLEVDGFDTDEVETFLEDEMTDDDADDSGSNDDADDDADDSDVDDDADDDSSDNDADDDADDSDVDDDADDDSSDSDADDDADDSGSDDADDDSSDSSSDDDADDDSSDSDADDDADDSDSDDSGSDDSGSDDSGDSDSGDSGDSDSSDSGSGE